MIIKQFFNHAIKPYRLISNNSLNEIPLYFKQEKKELTVLSVSEIDTLVQNIKDNHKYYYHVVTAIGGYAGLRYGEVIGLKWSDIDLDSGTISVDKQWNYIEYNVSGFTTTKTLNSNRTIPIPKKLVDIIKDYKSHINMNILPERLFYNVNTHFRYQLIT